MTNADRTTSPKYDRCRHQEDRNGCSCVDVVGPQLDAARALAEAADAVLTDLGLPIEHADWCGAETTGCACTYLPLHLLDDARRDFEEASR